MHIRTITIENVRSVHKARWLLPPSAEAAGWHVILGANGAGKTTFLQSVVIALLGSTRAEAIRLEKGNWLTNTQKKGSATVEYVGPQESRKLTWQLHRAGRRVNWSFSGSGNVTPSARARIHQNPFFPGFLSAFGPFRRFGGSALSMERRGTEIRHLEQHLSLFEDQMVFGDSIDWLQQLRFQQLEDPEGKTGAEELLNQLIEFINQDEFLPFGTQLDSITSRAVMFRDGNGARIPIEELSDGYRSVLCLALTLVCQLESFHGRSAVFGDRGPTEVQAPGIVLIDEVDVHLHPQWQRDIGRWFRKHFPNIQFFVTTHSPLVCQAAEVGTVFVLPDPGTDEVGRMITGTELDRLLYGNVLEAFGTAAFDVPFTRSEAGREKLSRLAELNVKETRDGLTKQEQAEQHRLRAAFPTEAHARRNGASNP